MKIKETFMIRNTEEDRIVLYRHNKFPLYRRNRLTNKFTPVKYVINRHYKGIRSSVIFKKEGAFNNLIEYLKEIIKVCPGDISYLRYHEKQIELYL